MPSNPTRKPKRKKTKQPLASPLPLLRRRRRPSSSSSPKAMSDDQPNQDLIPAQSPEPQLPSKDHQSLPDLESDAPPQEPRAPPLESLQEDASLEDTQDGADSEAPEPHSLIPAAPAPAAAAAASVSCPLPSPRMTPKKNPGKRKKWVSKKVQAAAEQKLAFLGENFCPFLFPVPTAAAMLDIAKHESLFRSLGLWTFAHLPLDRNLRCDLLSDLIAFYEPSRHLSTVKGVRITVTRAGLAHALGLPVKKEKAASSAGDPTLEAYSKEELFSLVEGFISKFMLFQFQDEDEDDACILPQEIANVHQMAREGQLQKVDWAGLIWSLVERELLEVPKSGRCYYASHMQQLIRHQKPRLFQEVEIDTRPEPFPEEEASEDITMVDEEDEVEDDAEVVSEKVKTLDEFNNMELSLNLGSEADVMDGSDRCSEREEDNWLEEDKNEGLEHCLRRCNSNIGGSMEFENLCRDDGEAKSTERYADDLCAKLGSFEKLTSTDLQTMDTIHAPYNQGSSLDLSSGDFLTMRDDSHRNTAVDPGRSGSFCFANNGKRNIGEIDVEEDDDDDEGDENIQRFSHGNLYKRMRSNGLWEHPQSEFYALMEQSESFQAKAKMIFSQKEEECMNAQVQIHYLTEYLQQKDQRIESLEKMRMEEQQKWEFQVGRYEHELKVLKDLVIGYKKALKDTRTAFIEYRNNFPQGDKPLYKEVEGGGGLVLTASELEKQSKEKEEETFCELKLIIHHFRSSWYSKLDQYASSVAALNGRLGKLFEEIDLLKERRAKIKESDA